MNLRPSLELIDKPTFRGAFALLLVVMIPLIIWPEQRADWCAEVNW